MVHYQAPAAFARANMVPDAAQKRHSHLSEPANTVLLVVTT
jgi:hypothetical protein